MNAPVQAAVFFYARVLPVALGALAMVAAMRHHLPLRWPLIGSAIIAVVAGLASISVTLPTDQLPGEFEVGGGISTASLGLAALNVMLILAPPALRWSRPA